MSCLFFFFKQKTAYEMRISDWSSDVCSSDLRPKGVFLIPTLQNPTAAVLPDDRRDAVAAIVERHGMLLVEDDIYRPFADDPPAPLAARIPEHAVSVPGASTHMAPGLRVGALRAEERRVRKECVRQCRSRGGPS